MSGQMSYSYKTPKGVAGSLFDISPYRVDSRVNGEPGDAMQFGMGVVQGGSPGVNVAVPVASSEPGQFEGLLLTGFVNEMDMGGNVKIRPLQTVGILRWGKAWARVASDVEPVYGEGLYVVLTGPDRGKFTNDSEGTLPVNGRFVGGLGTGAIAPVEIFNQNPKPVIIDADPGL